MLNGGPKNGTKNRDQKWAGQKYKKLARQIAGPKLGPKFGPKSDPTFGSKQGPP